MTRTLTLVALAVVWLAAAAPALAQQQMPAEGTTIPVLEGSEPSLAAPGAPADPGAMAPTSGDPSAPFLEALSPYGTWISLEGFGLVWQPDTRIVGSAYTPYVTDGHWEMTNVGWEFASDQAFAWAVYHYGRWLYDDEFGWVWAPGTEWGASWVDWQMADGYVGWAPLPPAGYAYPAGYGPSYVFVSITYLTSYDLWPYLVMGAGVRRYVEMATPCGFGWYEGRSWPYGPGMSVFTSAGIPVRGLVIPVPPTGRVYRGAVEVNASPGWGSVPVRSGGGTVPASVVVNAAPGRAPVTVNVPTGPSRAPVAVNAPPPPWMASAAPRWGANPRFASPVGVAPRYAEVPGIHSVVPIRTPTNIAPRFVPQATNYARPPPPMPSMYAPAAVGAPAGAPAVASWRGTASPGFNGGFNGGAAYAPSYGGGFRPSAPAPSYGGGAAVVGGGFAGGGFAGGGGGGGGFRPSMPAPSFGGGGGFAGGGGFRPSMPAPSFGGYRPAPAVAPSFGGGGGFVGGGFRPSVGGFRR